MTITEVVIEKIIRRLLKSQDYRIEVITLINAEFLQFAIDFFKQVIEAKLKNHPITTDWYKAEFLNHKLKSKQLIINSGLNKKTISNMFNSTNREVVLEATEKHYEQLYESISRLVEEGSDIDLKLTIRFKDVSVDLNINESLIVINTLAVKRAELRGGAWSSAGKRVEKKLMTALCHLYEVPPENYKFSGLTNAKREVDFFLVDRSNTEFACEVKLMGKGNPESADATIARDSKIFIADKLSDLNKIQLANRKVEWVELRSEEGFRKFEGILHKLDIPHMPLPKDTDKKIDAVLKTLFAAK